MDGFHLYDKAAMLVFKTVQNVFAEFAYNGDKFPMGRKSIVLVYQHGRHDVT